MRSKAVQNEARDAEICHLYLTGMTVRQLGQQFHMHPQRVYQILRRMKALKSYRDKPRTGRDAFVGVNISAEAKHRLEEEAASRGTSISALGAEAIDKLLAERDA